MLGIGAAVALGGVVLRGFSKLAFEKTFTFSAKKAVRYLHEKNKGKETKLSKFLETVVGVTNEELLEMINQRADEVKEALVSDSKKLDDTGQGLLEMTRQIQGMMVNYRHIGTNDRKFVQSLKAAIEPDTLASEIVRSMKKSNDVNVLRVEDITNEIGAVFSGLGWDDKFDELQTHLARMEKDIQEILSRTESMADDVSVLKDKLEDGNLGKTETAVSDSAMTRSNVVSAGGDVKITTVDSIMNINAQELSKDDWKDVLSDAILGFGIGLDLDSDLETAYMEECLSESDIAMKYEEVDSMYGDLELEEEIYLSLGNNLYLSGEYKKAYHCYRKAMAEKRKTAMANMNFMFSDRNFRHRVLIEITKVKDKLFFNLEELYDKNDSGNYKKVKRIHDEMTLFIGEIHAAVEGVLDEGETGATVAGIDVGKYGTVASLYDKIFDGINNLCRRTVLIRGSILSGKSDLIAQLATPMRNDILTLRNRFKARIK
ncbi:MAG: hypothetical protein QF682_12065 [Candidatus Thermoplasmatota archaeon]|nr:hypothetical protein [Candidatus Thermoplasmatota archaeon]